MNGFVISGEEALIEPETIGSPGNMQGPFFYATFYTGIWSVKDNMLKFLKNLFAGLFGSKPKAAKKKWNENSWGYCDLCNNISMDFETVRRGLSTYKLCRRCRKPESLKQFLYGCDLCKKIVTNGSLTVIDRLVLCKECLEDYAPPCPECHTRITSDDYIFTDSCQKYCKSCAKKLGLKPRKRSENSTQSDKSSSVKKKKKNTGASEKTVSTVRITLSPAAGTSTSARSNSGGISDMQTLSMMLSGKKTSLESLVKKNAHRGRAFSYKNYYHPEFDDNLPDDFVEDGIGGLDDKYDK